MCLRRSWKRPPPRRPAALWLGEAALGVLRVYMVGVGRTSASPPSSATHVTLPASPPRGWGGTGGATSRSRLSLADSSPSRGGATTVGRSNPRASGGGSGPPRRRTPR